MTSYSRQKAPTTPAFSSGSCWVFARRSRAFSAPGGCGQLPTSRQSAYWASTPSAARKGLSAQSQMYSASAEQEGQYISRDASKVVGSKGMRVGSM